MYDALTAETDQWLHLRSAEVSPEVVIGDRPTRVVWSSLWPVSPGDRIEFQIRKDGEGALRFVWTSPSPPDERGIGFGARALEQGIQW